MTCTLQQADAEVLANAHTRCRAETIGRVYNEIYVQMTLMECPLLSLVEMLSVRSIHSPRQPLQTQLPPHLNPKGMKALMAFLHQ